MRLLSAFGHSGEPVGVRFKADMTPRLSRLNRAGFSEEASFVLRVSAPGSYPVLMMRHVERLPADRQPKRLIPLDKFRCDFGDSQWLRHNGYSGRNLGLTMMNRSARSSLLHPGWHRSWQTYKRERNGERGSSSS